MQAGIRLTLSDSTTPLPAFQARVTNSRRLTPVHRTLINSCLMRHARWLKSAYALTLAFVSDSDRSCTRLLFNHCCLCYLPACLILNIKISIGTRSCQRSSRSSQCNLHSLPPSSCLTMIDIRDLCWFHLIIGDQRSITLNGWQTLITWLILSLSLTLTLFDNYQCGGKVESSVLSPSIVFICLSWEVPSWQKTLPLSLVKTGNRNICPDFLPQMGAWTWFGSSRASDRLWKQGENDVEVDFTNCNATPG